MELTGKRILVVGMASSGIAAALFLRQRKALVVLSERRTADEVRTELPALLDAGVAIETGGHRERTFLDSDLIVVSPGVPADLAPLQRAREQGIPIWSEIELASRFLKGSLVAITGANGKTTTTTLVGEVLAACGRRVQVGGNIGVPLITLAEGSDDECVNVVEASSFQLETIVEFHPRVAAVLNVTPDHLDRHGSMEAYAAAKERIFENQTADDIAVLNHNDRICRGYAERVKSRVVWFAPTGLNGAAGASVRQRRDGEREIVWNADGREQVIMPVSEVPLRGAHNLENVLAAVAVACALEGPAPRIREAIKTFKAVEHRLEFVARVGGVDYFNDSKATNVDAALKALEAFPGGVWMILGGKDKNSDYTPLAEPLKARARGVLLIGAASEKIRTQLAALLPPEMPLVRCGTLDQAVTHAQAQAQTGDTVLLAPACSSFDQFRNYGHRGQVFKHLVATLTQTG